MPRHPPAPSNLPPPSKSFIHKKSQILAELATPESVYQDKSPKGTVDVQIRELIREINDTEGLVTTSSCAGRVAVFVEGSKDRDHLREWEDGERGRGSGEEDDATGDENEGEVVDADDRGIKSSSRSDTIGGLDKEKRKKIKTGPGGKGGGRWLYVSHDPIICPDHGPQESEYFTRLFGLDIKSDHGGRSITPTKPTEKDGSEHQSNATTESPRLIRLSFSPLILHVLCASLHHARPLLSAAINAGFRESGVQSLKGLDDQGMGTMVAIRTAGVNIETVVGIVESVAMDSAETGKEREQHREIMRRCVSEEYLKTCAGVVNERFQANDTRKEAFVKEFRIAMSRAGMTTSPNGHEEAREADWEGQNSGELDGKREYWESKNDRRQRKRKEGLRKRNEIRNGTKEKETHQHPENKFQDIQDTALLFNP